MIVAVSSAQIPSAWESVTPWKTGTSLLPLYLACSQNTQFLAPPWSWQSDLEAKEDTGGPKPLSSSQGPAGSQV